MLAINARSEKIVHANVRCHEPAAPTISETLTKFAADDKTGLTDAEVQARLKKYGPNALAQKQKNAFAALLAYFWEPIPWMIEAAALMAFHGLAAFECRPLVSQAWLSACLGSWLLLA